MYIQLENVGRSFVGCMHFDICEPLNEHPPRQRRARSRVEVSEVRSRGETAAKVSFAKSGKTEGGDGLEALKAPEVEASEELKKHFQVREGRLRRQPNAKRGKWRRATGHPRELRFLPVSALGCIRR